MWGGRVPRFRVFRDCGLDWSPQNSIVKARGNPVKWIGCLLLFSGWMIVIAALLLLAGSGQRLAFVAAGLLVELLGIALLAWHYRTLQRGIA